MKNLKTLLMISAVIGSLATPTISFASVEKMPAFEAALDKLPKDKAENFRDHLQQAHEDNQNLYDQAHQLREDMHVILTADTFDQNAFEAKSQQLRQIHDQIAENLDKAFVAGVAELSAPERKKLAHALHQARKEEHAAKHAAPSQK